MEQLFSPCTRTLENQGSIRPPEMLQELILDVSTEDILSAERAFTYADLYAVLGNGETIAWMTPHAVVAYCKDGRAANIWMQMHGAYQLCVDFNADGKEIDAWAFSPEHLLEICNVVLRLLAASIVHSVTVHSCIFPHVSTLPL